MKINNIKQLVLYTAGGIIISAFLFGLPYLFLIKADTDHILIFSLFILLLTISVSAVIWLLVERFIYRRIKVIYKTIHSLKKGNPSLGENLKGNIIDDVQNEVFTWARVKQDELSNLKEQEKFRREYIGNVSHELKTPIFNLKGYVHTLIDGGLFDESINMDYLYKCAKNLDRITAIVEDLNLISILESETELLQVEPINIRQIANEVAESFEDIADANDIKIDFKGELTGNINVMGDKHYIRQVLVNLVSNAIKYGAEKEGYVKISFYDMDKRVLIEVSDNGLGISEENLNRLFERFFRADKSRSRDKGGTGLGLSIVKHIIEAHGQTVNVRSKVGVGSTFGFTLEKA